MSNFSNETQVVLGAAVWVFGGDGYLKSSEGNAIVKAFKNSRIPWYLEANDENYKWIINLYAGGNLHLYDIIDAIENEFNFSLQEKYQLYLIVCLTMDALKQGSHVDDGWEKARDFRRALGIDRDDYNRWS
jgi:hypothetical protein